jgi:hypothetical protein
VTRASETNRPTPQNRATVFRLSKSGGGEGMAIAKTFPIVFKAAPFVQAAIITKDLFLKSGKWFRFRNCFAGCRLRQADNYRASFALFLSTSDKNFFYQYPTR